MNNMIMTQYYIHVPEDICPIHNTTTALVIGKLESRQHIV